MFALMIALALAGGNPTDNSARAHMTACFKGSIEKADAAKITPDRFADFAKQSCAGEITSFRSEVIAYDVKAGWARKKAELDADGQVGDYLADWVDRYREKGSITATK